ncbi:MULTISPECIES: hypothetical protein [Nocardia]|uniref:hypothetical protein n=1 Tax=Nocardia TaxID=1817 RepID=UPI000D69369B|nr:MULTISPECIES: hypothetical protein [Nocardia]
MTDRRIWARLCFNRYTRKWTILYRDKNTVLGFYFDDTTFDSQAEAAIAAERHVSLARVYQGDEQAA